MSNRKGRPRAKLRKKFNLNTQNLNNRKKILRVERTQAAMLGELQELFSKIELAFQEQSTVSGLIYKRVRDGRLEEDEQAALDEAFPELAPVTEEQSEQLELPLENNDEEQASCVAHD